MSLSLIGYETNTYQRAVRCSQCGKMIPKGRIVYGRCNDGRTLSGRICESCHEIRENKAIKRVKELECQ